MHRIYFQLKSHGFHTSARVMATTRFNLPAMSPTMTEGTILKWAKKEGESFSAGDVLLELETDKAQIDVEAPEDGVLAKIIMTEGSKAPVNTLIALLAEEGDDLSAIETPSEDKADTPEKSKDTPEKANQSTPLLHSDIKTSQILTPAVLSLVMRHGIKDVDRIKGSGKNGRILKGDVLAHLGLIAPQPAPPPRMTAVPPRDQIVIVKSDQKQQVKQVKAETKKTIPTFISKEVPLGDIQVNDDFIVKATERALYDMNADNITVKNALNGIKIFNLAPPAYDFITDSYQPTKPYVMTMNKKSKKENGLDEIDLIGYLGGESVHQKSKTKMSVEIQLDGGVPGRILNDKRASALLDRVEYYLEHPKEL
ncbi:hypothetical protein BDB01DRAFT_833922 [Pilobolus umbonatus]|nr:hypothetical protein BDB01DRAFT_833922 [Pilobolus umbonatus]